MRESTLHQIIGIRLYQCLIQLPNVMNQYRIINSTLVHDVTLILEALHKSHCDAIVESDGIYLILIIKE